MPDLAPQPSEAALSTVDGSPPDGRSTDGAQIEIRPARTRADLEACVELQRDTWGKSFSEVVPVSMMQVTCKMGGICMGAFAPGGEMLGVVYGVTGVRNGELAHWSHMLAVRPRARNMGIGKRLKLAQREGLKARGVSTMYWTYDPLVARNAHLNLNLLGASIDRFVPDMYGASDSDLHRSGTDRFIVKWDLNAECTAAAVARREARARRGGSRPMLGIPGDDVQVPRGLDAVEVVIPSDIEAIEARSFDEALEWRRSSRRAFQKLLAGPYEVSGFIAGGKHARYVVSRVAAR